MRRGARAGGAALLAATMLAAGCSSGDGEMTGGAGGDTASGNGGSGQGDGGGSGQGGGSGNGGSGGSGGVGSGGSGAGQGGGNGGSGAGGSGAGGSTGSVGDVIAAGVRWVGRVDLTDATHPKFAWSGSGFVARFNGTSLTAQLSASAGFIFKAVVDGVPQAAFTATAGGSQPYMLATDRPSGSHTVELYRQTEGGQGNAQLMGLTVGGGALDTPPSAPARLIELIGDSITCGYGELGTIADSECFTTEDHWDTYEAIAARMLGAEVSTIAASGRGVYRNYGGDMTDTMPSVYTRALTNYAAPDWDFRTKAQAVVINLGTNDISNNKGDPGMPFRDAYLGLVENVRSKYPDAYIFCMVAPLLGTADQATIQGHITDVVAARAAAGDTKIELFDKIAPQTSDKYACQYHPNMAENQLMATALVAELKAKLGW